MKLKVLVVASMSVLGLISCPGVAAAHAKHKHHMAKQEMTSPVDYKAMGALQPAESCPGMDQFGTYTMQMSHNIGRAVPTEDCNKLLTIAGGINFDAHWGNRGMGYQGENVQRASLNDAYLNVFGNVNEWTKAFASLSYNDATTNNDFASTVTTLKNGQYSSLYRSGNVNLEQGIIRFANYDEAPFFVQLGKQFQPFGGDYQIHPIQRSMTQVMSESLQDSGEIGFLTRMGFYGAAYAFDNSLKERYAYALGTVEGHTKTNYGASLGFGVPSDELGYDIRVGYLYNFIGVNDVAQAVSQYNGLGIGGLNTNGSYHNRVSAGSIYGSVNSGPFSISATYVGAFQAFSNNDLGSKGTSAVAAGTGSGAKPWASNVQAGYKFDAWSKSQNVYLGFQASGDAVNVFLPKSRWLVGYGVDMWKNTSLGAEIGHDTDYSTSQGGTGDSSNTIGVRAAVKFG